MLKKHSKIKLKKSKKIIKILTVERLTFQKNQILLIKALNQIKNLNFKLTIVGNGKEESNLQKYIDRNRLDKKIRIIKNISNTKKYMIKNEVFILTSRYEGLPNVLIEAQLNKKFIIFSNCASGPKEILMNGKAGYLFKNNDIVDLKNKINNYIKNKDKKEILDKIEKGFKNLNRFNEMKNLQQYYKEIVSL